MVGRNGGADLRGGALDEIGAIFRGKMLHRHAQTGELLDEFRQAPIDEHGFAVENIDVRADLLAVHQERHADFLHAFQHARDFHVVGDTDRRIGRGIRRIKLDGGEHAVAKTPLDVVRIGLIGQIAGHQRREARPLRQRGPDPFAIGRGLSRRSDGRNEVRHENSAAEMPRRVWQHSLKHFAVANVEMPVVGPANNDAGGHLGINNHRIRPRAMLRCPQFICASRRSDCLNDRQPPQKGPGINLLALRCF